MKKLDVENWKKVPIPAGVVVAILIAAYTAFTWATGDSGIAFAGDLKKLERKVDRRFLEQEQRRLSSDVLKLEVKQQAYPQKFDAVDKAVLKQSREDLKVVNDDIRQLKSK